MPRLQIAHSIPRFRQLNCLPWKACVVQLGLYTAMLCLLLLANPASAETRDPLGTLPASYLDPVSYVPAETSRSVLTGTRAIGQRSAFIDIEDYLTGDPCLYMREAWLQNREFKVSDGNVEIASTF